MHQTSATVITQSKNIVTNHNAFAHQINHLFLLKLNVFVAYSQTMLSNFGEKRQTV